MYTILAEESQYSRNKSMKNNPCILFLILKRMAAGSRLPRFSHGIFFSFSNFSNTPYLTSLNRL